MFNIGAGEWIALMVIAVVLVGPDRLPHVASEAAKWVKKFKEMTSNATAELKENLGPGFEDLNITDLNPKKFVQKTINSAMEDAVPIAELREIQQSAKIDPDLL